MFWLAIAAIVLSISALCSNAYSDYDNDFIDPSYILAKQFNPSTAAAQQSIINWADFLAAQGPWSVVNKSVTPPTGNKHDYMSWAPYEWPNCTSVGNTTELQPAQIWAECPYYYRDGQFNPDRLLVNNTGDFQAMSDAVLYNTLAWVLTGSSNYSANAAHYVDTWFINPDTAQTPNLQYAQMERGPDGQVGTHTGALDLKQMAKLTSAILILRNGKSPDWTDQLNSQMNNWTTHYIGWLTTSPIAYLEWTATNNHGTFFYNQLASLQILIGDIDGAKNTTQTYFKKQYLAQINADGVQPEEAARTHPYHYQAYNLAAMIVNAKIGKYLGMDFWNTTTKNGGTIKLATDHVMTFQPNVTEGDGPIWELYPSIAAVAAHFGDPDNKYANFMAEADNTYPSQPYFFFNQNFSDSGLAAAKPKSGSPNSQANGASKLLSCGMVVIYIVTLFSFLGTSISQF